MTTTCAQLYFGLRFDGDYEFPWDQEKYNFSFDVWNNGKTIIKTKMNIDGSTILVLPNKIIETKNFDQREVSIEELKITEIDADLLYEFCKEYNLKVTAVPKWYLIVEEKETK